jgi:hypothetical protein
VLTFATGGENILVTGNVFRGSGRAGRKISACFCG